MLPLIVMRLPYWTTSLKVVMSNCLQGWGDNPFLLLISVYFKKDISYGNSLNIFGLNFGE